MKKWVILHASYSSFIMCPTRKLQKTLEVKEAAKRIPLWAPKIQHVNMKSLKKIGIVFN